MEFREPDLGRESGQTMAEYVVTLTVITVLIVLSFSMLAGATASILGTVVSAV